MIVRKLDRLKRRGLSLVEALMTIAVIGIFTGIAIPIYGKNRERAESFAARTELEWMNEALALYRQTVAIPSNPADNGSASHAQAVIDLLTTDIPLTGVETVGFPFLKPTPTLQSVSGSDMGYRYQWDGVGFVLVLIDGGGNLRWTGKDYRKLLDTEPKDGFILNTVNS